MAKHVTTRSGSSAQVAASALAALGAIAALALLALPQRWIEDTFGVEPDGGNGTLEFLPVAVLVLVALASAGRAVRSRRRQVTQRSPSTG